MSRVLGSIGLAFDIVKGSIRLLRMHPVLIVPIMPVFLMVIALEYALFFFVDDLIRAFFLIFVVAFELMFSFVITGNMIQQIHEKKQPSLADAFTSSTTVRLIPKVALLSIVWFTLILLIMAVEIAINSLLNRGQGARAGGILDSIFGTVADALRMMGFMMIPIMLFENVGLSQGFRRLKSTLTDSPIAALGGLALTKLASTLIFFIILGIQRVVGPLSFSGFLITFALVGIGWMFSMYPEQLFVTGLYLYVAIPDSDVVRILLEKQIGRELPSIPSPGVEPQPATP